MAFSYFTTFLYLVAGICHAAATFDAPTPEEVAEIKDIIQSRLDGDTSTVGATLSATPLRLAFHDCVGGKCDGCINLNNAANNGLADVIEELEDLYLNEEYAIYDIMSRADFWQLSAIYSIEVAIKISNRNCDSTDCTMPDPEIPFKWGREDCNTAPSTEDLHEFPEPTMTRSEMMDYFSLNFDMDEAEVTALLGAHSYGGAARTQSGYNGLWTVGSASSFNTKFYQLLVDDSLTYDNKAMALRSRTDRKYQFDLYDTDGELVGFMLNTDVELIADIDVDPLEGTTCTIHDGCTEADTYNQVKEYASDPTKFMEDYRNVHLKMSETGYIDLQEVS